MNANNLIVRKKNGTVNRDLTILKSLRMHANFPEAAYAGLADAVGDDPTGIFYKSGGHLLPVGEPLNREGIGRVISLYRQSKRENGHRSDMHLSLYADIYSASKKSDLREVPAEVPADVPAPEVPAEIKPYEGDGADFLAWIVQVQAWQKKEGVREWGYRQAIMSAKLLKAGLPAEAVKDAFLIDLDKEGRRFHGVSEFDVIGFGNQIRKDGESAIEAVVRLIQGANVNVALIGGAGIGKTTVVEKIASDAEGFCAVSCNPETSSPDFYGIQTPMHPDGAFVLSDFTKALLKAEALKKAGSLEKIHVLLDEGDAMDTGTALMLNRALEQKRMSHRFLGRTIDFGDNIVFTMAMNTTGGGADSDYTGRDNLDAAFLDRFFRIRVTRDDAVQAEIFSNLMSA